MRPRLLIFSADDYGLSEDISRGILRAHDTGLVSSVSVLAVGPAVVRAAAGLRDRPGLGVGAHLAAVGEDPPLLSQREIPTLVDRRGAFKTGWRSFMTAAMAGRVDMADVRREYDAQLERLVRDLRLRPGHIDTHQHLHLYPPIARVVTELATRWGITAVRVPTSAVPGPRGMVIRRWSRSLSTRLRAAGLAFPAGYGGLDEAGSLTLSSAERLLERLARGPARTIEVNFHPGEPSAADRLRYAWGYRWEEELAGLTSPALRETLRRLDLRLGRFTDLPAP
ncbi:ChbG/HpnK family deacetylase [Streptomyces varsoviensis]|uniref:ChbG/HpnK family deacetylase n=1 Tax=Streptomyces varsoviensis TaxID=67373 RepID=UPI00068A6850|nr:ChbG/HpnK family deacetylase [Streptomyces varsoviensis]